MCNLCRNARKVIQKVEKLINAGEKNADPISKILYKPISVNKEIPNYIEVPNLKSFST